MTDPFGPAPGMPGAPGPQPSTPPPGWTPQQQHQPRTRSKLPWLVGLGVLVVLAVIAGAVLLLSGPGEASDARSVQDVADLAVAAADDLDVDAGVDLLCEAPSKNDREELDDLISSAQDEAGTDDPEVEYDVSDVKGDATGSFVVDISSDEEGLEDRDFSIRVNVGRDGDRSCIEGAEAP